MKLVAPLSALLVACAAPRPSAPPCSPADEAAVARELDDFHAAAAAADEPRYFDHFTPDGVFLGTDMTERWVAPAFRTWAHPHFAKGKAWSFHATRRVISVLPGGRVAWFDEDLATEKLGPARGSGVLLKDASGRFKIAQYVLSLTIPNERFDDVRKALEAN